MILFALFISDIDKNTNPCRELSWAVTVEIQLGVWLAFVGFFGLRW
jgi:hypothetical protein